MDGEEKMMFITLIQIFDTIFKIAHPAIAILCIGYVGMMVYILKRGDE